MKLWKKKNQFKMATIMNYEVLDLFVPNCIYEGSEIRAMALSRE
jgi:hypothetical protein